MSDIIINGYLIMWATLLFISWIPIGFIWVELTSEYQKPTGKKRQVLKAILIANTAIVIVCLLTLPIQIALITELWRG